MCCGNTNGLIVFSVVAAAVGAVVVVTLYLFFGCSVLAAVD